MEQDNWCWRNRYAISGILGGITLVNLALIPLYLTFGSKEDEQCPTTTYRDKYGSNARLGNCNDTITECTSDTEAQQNWIKCSILGINLPIMKQSNVGWHDFITISSGIYLFYKYGKCLEQTNSSIALPNDITCAQNSTLFPCVPYIRSNCPSTSNINEFGVTDGYNLTTLKRPALISVYKNVCEGENSDNLCINISTEINCNGVCSPCSSDLVASFLPLNGSSGFDLC